MAALCILLAEGNLKSICRPLQVAPRNAVALTEQDKADASGVYEPPGDPVVARLAFSPAGDVMATVDSYPSTGGRWAMDRRECMPETEPAIEQRSLLITHFLPASGAIFGTTGHHVP